jgi:two-component system, OmpR family, sensor histidine kinase CpxA
MKHALRFPLLAKVLAWLVLHLVILGLAFFGFVRWQLGLGLDSLLSGSAGDRLTAFGDSVLPQMIGKSPDQWNEAILPLAEKKQVTAGIFEPRGTNLFPRPIPENILKRTRESLPPPRSEQGRPPPPEFRDRPPPRPKEDEPSARLPESRPVFLMRGDDGGYWAGVLLQLPPLRGMPNRPAILLLHADRLDGSGMFFDFKPWLWGGLAVLALSLAFWTPFVWSITRYLRQLTAAADKIASGRFQISLPARGNDELGNLGRSVESMAARLDHLIAGQKRFLGDAAHELCAPLARIRTALGILETRLAESDSTLLASIEADTKDLASLVDEILAFSRTGNRQPQPRVIELEPLIREVLARECSPLETEVRVPPGLTVTADPALLGRALGNLVRNATIHTSPGTRLEIEASTTPESVSISVTDNGPGVPENELRKIFEPFHRLDLARSRDTGGSGLGLAIVRSAVEACGGEVSASLPPSGGLCVTLKLPVETEPHPSF